MSKNLKIFKESYHKFRQINKYLEILDDIITEMEIKNLIIDNKLNILDFGCGKSYLTFSIYYYLKKYKPHISFNILGLDLKEDVINLCNKLKEKLNYTNINFITQDIKDFNGDKTDIVISLHACNNATDYSILKALELKSSVFIAVPCCQSEFYKNMKNKDLGILNSLKESPILLEKTCSILTDNFRVLALQKNYYETKAIEFISEDITPKNILIRAIKNTKMSIEKYEK